MFEGMATMPKITEMFCFASYDKDEHDEGIPTILTRFGPLPLVGADMDLVSLLLPQAQRAANSLGRRIRIYKFTCREQIGEIIPDSERPADYTSETPVRQTADPAV